MFRSIWSIFKCDNQKRNHFISLIKWMPIIINTLIHSLTLIIETNQTNQTQDQRAMAEERARRYMELNRDATQAPQSWQTFCGGDCKDWTNMTNWKLIYKNDNFIINTVIVILLFLTVLGSIQEIQKIKKKQKLEEFRRCVLMNTVKSETTTTKVAINNWIVVMFYLILVCVMLSLVVCFWLWCARSNRQKYAALYQVKPQSINSWMRSTDWDDTEAETEQQQEEPPARLPDQIHLQKVNTKKKEETPKREVKRRKERDV